MTHASERLPQRRRLRGFTLIEVLIAIALALVLGVTMFVFLQDLLATRSRTVEFASRQRAAATLIERLESDVAACLVGDSRNGAGVQGDADRLRLLTRGVMTQLASRGLDDPAALADLHSVEYHYNASDQSIDARKNAVGESSEFTSLGGPIAHLRFRYLDGRTWKDSFDSLALDRLPNAIEVCLWFSRWADETADAPTTRSDEFSGNFDERAYAAASDADSFRPPPPDRRRVIVIPDGGAEETNDAAE
jgi:prepilin-type N-terminal cleavage/methylation domain-containing protein